MLYKLALLGVLGSAAAMFDPDMARPTNCTQTKDECKASLANANVCNRNMTANVRYDASACCPTCKKPRNATTTPAECTKEKAMKCIKDAPKCGEEEIPIREDGSCCRSCVNPKRKMALKRVAECAKQPECNDIQEAAKDFMKQDSRPNKAFCPKCRKKRPAPPTCDPDCDEKQVCVKKGNSTSTETKCVRKKIKKLKFKAKATAKAFLKDATKEQVREMLIEMVERFCENAKNEDKCKKHISVIREKLMVKLGDKKADGAEVQVEVSLPDEPEATTRRLLATDTAMDLVTEATANAADDELEVAADDTADAGDADSGEKDSAFVQGASLAVSVGLLLMVL